jgi:hypothetical protein
MSDALTYVKASCHCGANAFQIPFLASKLPQASDFCHCNACRHITGELAVHCAVLEGQPLSADSGVGNHKPADLSNLTKYNASENLTRYFCSTCSAYLLYETKGTVDPHWSVSTGALERTEGIVKVGYHAFLADTLDGGLAHHYRELHGVEIPRYEFDEGGKQLPLGWKAESLLKKQEPPKAGEEGEERLSAYCHCKNISIYFTRAKQEEAKDPSKWWIVERKDDDPTSRVRFMCGHCLCTSCRTTSGSLVNSWVILPRVNAIDARTSLPVTFAFPKDANEPSKRPKGLKQYRSSDETFREFCGTCGACAFYWTRNAKDSRVSNPSAEEPDVIDVGAGLLDQEDGGSRAEGWCFWFDKVIFGEDGIDKAGKEALEAGVKAAASEAPSSA